HFINFNRIGIRYISEFANIDILEKIKFNATLPSVKGRVVNSTYRFVFDEDKIFKNIQIASKLPVNAILQETKEQVNFVSLLDVDIVRKGLNIRGNDELWYEIDSLHTLEKTTFFELLTDEFLQSLNPEYT
ncbi:MAG TPA: TIGR04255 family protein, partial [Chitinophagaceae bacterium]|nr:TIGR04255 family protein [Chitinophagaceae bacterium]